MGILDNIVEALTPDKEPKEPEQLEREENAIDVSNKINEAMAINADLVSRYFPQSDRMYDGKHWNEEIDGVSYDRLVGYSKLVHNFCSDTIDRWTNFIGANPPDFYVMPASVASALYDVEAITETDLDENEAEAVKKTIVGFLRQNSWRTLFMDTAHVQARYGRVQWYVALQKGKHYPVVEIMKPMNSFPVFINGHYNELIYFVFRLEEDTELLNKKYNIEIASDANISFPQDRQKSYVYKVMTDKAVYIYAGNLLLETIANPYNKVPIFSAKNRTSPFSPHSKNDMQEIYGLQQAFNLTLSNLTDVIEDSVIGKRLIQKQGQTTDMSALVDRRQRHVTIGPETVVTDLHPSIAVGEITAGMAQLEEKIEDKTGMTELLKGRYSGTIATGVALSGLSKGIDDIAKGKIMHLSQMLDEAFNFVIFLMKTYKGAIPGTTKTYKEVMPRDSYYFDIMWDNVSIQDQRTTATTMIDLKNAGIISRYTAAKAVKIPYVEDEQKRVAYENVNPLLNPELALQMAQQQTASKKFDPGTATFKAKSENASLLRGIEMPADETDPAEIAIHLNVHKQIERMARGVGHKALNAHIALHEKAGQPAGPVNPPAEPGAPAGMGPQPSQAPATTQMDAAIDPAMGGAEAPNTGARPMAMPGVGNPV